MSVFRIIFLGRIAYTKRVQVRPASGPKEEMASLNSATFPSRLWHSPETMGGLKWQGSVNPALMQKKTDPWKRRMSVRKNKANHRRALTADAARLAISVELTGVARTAGMRAAAARASNALYPNIVSNRIGF